MVSSDKSYDCVVCGSCVVDVLVRPVDLGAAIGGGALVRTDPLALTTGGIVSNAGVTLARLGMRAAAMTCVGDSPRACVHRAPLDFARPGEPTREALIEPCDGRLRIE